MTDGPAKSGRTLLARLIDEVGLWGQCEDFPRRDWVYEASNNDTQVGYWEWVIAKHDLEVEADALASGVPAVDTSSERVVSEAVVRQVVNGVADDVLEAAWRTGDRCQGRDQPGGQRRTAPTVRQPRCRPGRNRDRQLQR